MATYATTSEVRDFCQLEGGDLGLQDESKFEDLIDALILFAEKIIDDYCNVPSGFFIATGITITDEHHDHDGSGTIHLHYYPTVVTTLSVNALDLTKAPVWTLLTKHPAAGSDYIPYPEYRHHGEVYIYNQVPPAGRRNIKCTYKAGYATIPETITHMTKELVANTVRGILKRKLTPQDISQVIMAGGDIRLFFAEDWRLSASHKAVLDEYKVSKVRGKRG